MDVDIVHEREVLKGDLGRGSAASGRCVVDQNVDIACLEGLYGSLDDFACRRGCGGRFGCTVQMGDVAWLLLMSAALFMVWTNSSSRGVPLADV